jgi:hypothetical protein
MRNRGDVKHAHHLNHYETWQPQHAHMYSLSLKLESMVAVAHQGPVLQPQSNDYHQVTKLVAPTADQQCSGYSQRTYRHRQHQHNPDSTVQTTIQYKHLVKQNNCRATLTARLALAPTAVDRVNTCAEVQQSALDKGLV